MRYVLTNAQMRAADGFTINELKVPSLTLMERAGAALAAEAERICPAGGDVLCVCGGGNNGGDGFVCARLLLRKGISVAVLCTAEKFSAECKRNKEEFEKSGGEVYSVFPRRRFSLVVDCLFGTGFSGELRGKDAVAADYINASGAKVLSADIPSGVSGNSGIAAEKAVRADKTLCIGEYKAGVFLGDGIDLSGERGRADIGISLPELSDGQSYAFLVGREEVAALLPKRNRNSHKGTYGRVAVVAGSEAYTGAAYLSAAAALRSGAGYTFLFLPEKILPSFVLKLPEVLLSPLGKGGRVSFSETEFEKLLPFSAVAFGMGTDVSEDVFQGVCYLLKEYTGRLLLDADALNSLAKYGRDRLSEIFENKKCDVLLTPHIKEFSRLTGKEISEILAAGLDAPKEFAEKYGVTVLLKGAATVISDGQRTAINVSGTPAQAKGGSGDVLSGLVAGLCAGGLSVFDGAVAGAYLAGKAAELAAETTGEYSLTASDEIECLGRAFLSLEKSDAL